VIFLEEEEFVLLTVGKRKSKIPYAETVIFLLEEEKWK
jgi:hypothetical protein